MTDRYITPFADYGFKKLFGTEENKDLLISLLNAIIDDNDDPITDLFYKNVEQIGDIIGTRTNYFDVYCNTKNGRQFIVEMQNTWKPFFKDRTVYYAAKPIRDQGKVGTPKSKEQLIREREIQRAEAFLKEAEEKREKALKKKRGEGWNYNLKDVYLVAIMNFILPYKEYPANSYFHKIKLMDIEDHHVFYDKLTLIYIEMPKLLDIDLKLDTMRDKWMHALNHLYYYDDYPEELQEDVFKKLFEQAELARYTPDQQLTYERSRKVYLDTINDIEGARILGEEEGEERGKQLGIEEGREQEKLEIARKMMQSGMDYTTIKQLTGLSKEELAS